MYTYDLEKSTTQSNTWTHTHIQTATEQIKQLIPYYTCYIICYVHQHSRTVGGLFKKQFVIIYLVLIQSMISISFILTFYDIKS